MKISFLLSYRRDSLISPTYIDRQFNDVYAAFHDVKIDDLKVEKKEVQNVQLVTVDKFREMVLNRFKKLKSYF